MTITAFLSIFAMFGISSLAIFWARRLGLPHTVFLVIVGVAFGFLSFIPALGFMGEFQLTPELLFYLLLPTLIFESAYNMSIRRMVEDKGVIILLSIVGLLISTVIIGVGLYFVFMLFGIMVPLVVTLLFGALISATDPVAVLALFKEYGAPRRLSLIFEGESLFNDATAVALFLILLDVAIKGFSGIETVIGGITNFAIVLIGGTLFGLIMGGLFTKVIGLTRENETASITLTVVLAHVTFISAELISGSLAVGGFHIHISSIIATTVAALVMGNYGRAKIHPRAEEFVEKLWGQFAFMANSLVFILIGLLFVKIPLTETALYAPIIATILIVAVARMLSIYPVVGFANLFYRPKDKIPTSWQHLLSWGSLRGALAVTMVLLIPPTFTIPGWTLDFISPRDFLLSLTLGCIFATLFIKATTIRSFMKSLKLDALTEIERIEYQEARALVHREITERLERYRSRGYIADDIAERLAKRHTELFDRACADAAEISVSAREQLADRVLRLYAIGIEKRYLKELYHYEEVNERVFRRIMGKLTLQFEEVERGNLAPDMSIHTDGKDIFDRLASLFRALSPVSDVERQQDQYMYYRAQTIISRKVLKELGALERNAAESIFTTEALQQVVALYTTYREQSHKKMQAVADTHPAIVAPLSEELARQGIHKIEEHTLHSLHERELITPKLYIALTDEFAADKK